MPDANLDVVMDSVRWGIYFNAGQVCSAMSRVIAHEDVHDEIVQRCVALAESLSVGPGIERREFGANMGAMVSDGQRDRAEGQIRAGQIFINERFAGGVETPFGGYGRSGYGREKGREALWNYMQTKNIAYRTR